MAHVHHAKVTKKYLAQYEHKRKKLNDALPKGKKHRHAKALSLKVLAPYFLNVDPFWETPGNYDNEEYNRKDCVYTKDLHSYFSTNMTDDEKKFYVDRMLPWSDMLLKMTLRGIEIDEDKLDELTTTYQNEVQRLEQELDTKWADAHSAYRSQQLSILSKKYGDMRSIACLKSKDKSEGAILRVWKRYESLFASSMKTIKPEIN